MNNPSLKDQLKALSLGLSTPSNSTPKKNTPAKFKKEEIAKPAWLEQAQYGVELLKAYFPHCFKDLKEVQPLKKGIKQDLVKYLSTQDNIVLGDKACMVNSLAYYVNSAAYHKSVIAGVNRIDLEGNPAGMVTPEEAQYSTEYRKSKLQKKQRYSRPMTEETVK